MNQVERGGSGYSTENIKKFILFYLRIFKIVLYSQCLWKLLVPVDSAPLSKKEYLPQK